MFNKMEYIKHLAKLSDDDLYSETVDRLEDAICDFMDSGAISHWQCDMCRLEAKERESDAYRKAEDTLDRIMCIY